MSRLVGVSVAGGYLSLVMLLAYYSYRHTIDEADFLVAGREVGTLVGAGTLLASQISASTVVGAVGIHYTFGVGFAWVWAGILTGWVVSLFFVAPQLRRFGGMTVPEFIGARYADDGAGGDYARAISAVLIVSVFTIFLTAQYTAGALIFGELLGISQVYGASLTAVIAIVYTAVGGMRASVLTDFLQAVVLVIGLVSLVPLVLAEIGGFGTLITEVRAIDPNLLKQTLPLPDIAGFMLASAFGVIVAPMIVTRFYTLRNEETLRTAIGLSIVAQGIIATAVVVLGLSARVLFPELSVPDRAAILLSQEIFGPVLSTVFLLALVSAILSTVDSVLLVASTGLAHDIYGRLIRPDATKRRKMWVNRGAVVLVGLVPGVLFLYRDALGGLITLITLLNLSIQGSMLFAPIVLGLHWERATTAGGIGSMLAGLATVIVWQLGTAVFGVVPASVTRVISDPVVPGVVVSVLVLVGVSLLTDEPSPESTAEFFPDKK